MCLGRLVLARTIRTTSAPPETDTPIRIWICFWRTEIHFTLTVSPKELIMLMPFINTTRHRLNSMDQKSLGMEMAGTYISMTDRSIYSLRLTTQKVLPRAPLQKCETKKGIVRYYIET